MIYIVRHGQTNYNVEGRYAGRIDVELNNIGINQAKIINEKLQSIKFDKVFSSPLNRAYKTAQIITTTTIIKDDRIIERCNGVLEGKLKFKIKDNIDFNDPNLLNLNSRSRSNCGGCTACVHNYHNLYDSTVLKDKKQLKTKQDINEFFDSKNLDVSKLVQIAVVTGLFKDEDEIVEHMTLIDEVSKKRNFNGELMYFGCQVNSDRALKQLSDLGNFSLIYALDNFTKREMLLSKIKSLITLESARDTLLRTKDNGIKTSIAYISGIDH